MVTNDDIVVTGARVHNLKNVDVRIPREKLVVITGLSGSGKSSLAFDTIFAEGQRRYMETFSSYARGYIGTMQRPDVDKITGLSPVISIDQRPLRAIRALPLVQSQRCMIFCDCFLRVLRMLTLMFRVRRWCNIPMTKLLILFSKIIRVRRCSYLPQWSITVKVTTKSSLRLSVERAICMCVWMARYRRLRQA